MTILQLLRQGLGPVTTRPAWPELLRSGLGAGLGLAVAGVIVGLVDHWFPHSLFLFAPLGATAVLVFAVPSSPLAQPWNCVVGNTAAALYTLLLLWAFPALPQTAQAALAVGGAIMLMMLLRALHPPGGAVALLTVLASAQMLPLGWALLIPMSVLSAALVLIGVLYHRACGKPYPHLPTQQAAAQRNESRLALNEQDLQQLLQRFDQTNNLTAEDLGELLAAAEEEAIKRRFAAISCGEVMSPQLLTVQLQTPLEDVADIFHTHLVKSLPVVDAQNQLIGRVLRADLFDWLWQGHRAHLQQNLWQRLRKTGSQSQKQAVAQDLMREPELCVQESIPVGDLLQELASHTVQFIAVLRGSTLVGVITRSDVIRTLLNLNS